MIQKIIGEEATETVIAAKNNKKKRIIEETADLFFHLLVLLSQFDIKPEYVGSSFLISSHCCRNSPTCLPAGRYTSSPETPG